MSETAKLSRLVSVIDLPAAPVAIVAGERERQALAAANNLVAVESLVASVELSWAPAGAVVVAGRVTADIVQTCVVSLEPVPAHIDERFSVRYVRSSSEMPVHVGEVVVDAAAADPPELLTGPTIDVGALVEEHFILAIDPYPRAPGATLPDPALDAPQEGAASPFAALAAFARKSKGFGEK